MDMKKLGLVAIVAAGVAAVALSMSARDDVPAESERLKKPAPVVAQAAPAPHAAVQAPAVPAGPGGKAEFAETVFDAGMVERGAEIKHVFTIRNVGQHPLTVDAKPG